GDLLGEQSADGIPGGDAGSREELGGDEFGLFADVAGHGGLTSSWWSVCVHANLDPSWIQQAIAGWDRQGRPRWWPADALRLTGRTSDSCDGEVPVALW